MKIIDSHLHFWNPQTLPYPWLESVPVLNHAFEVAEFRQATENLQIDGVVFIEADCAPEQNVAEADWVAALPAPIKGIVAYAPLETGSAAKAALDSLSERPLVKGIRRLVQGEPIGFAVQPKFIEGVRLLADYNLSFDIGVRHIQLSDAKTLIAACPNVRFVLNHMGKPNIAEGDIDNWRKLMTAIAGFENVDMKFSGMVTEADAANWTIDDLRPYVDVVLKEFTPARMMFGSDWPVCTLAASYERWFSTAQTFIQPLSDAERQQIFAGTATRAYRLDA
ncbi:MAG: amidohydrolase family protein [Chloroflexi bacterium]|nr:amidohydrolase family protein [Chloroflexota bacterium]